MSAPLGINEFMGWSFPLLRIGRLAVRMSWLLPVWMLFDAINAARSQSWPLVAAAFVVPPMTMLLHALTHVWAARLSGGQAPQVILSLVNEQGDYHLPMRPWPHLLTGLAGPLTSLLIAGTAWLAAPLDQTGVLSYVVWCNAVVGIANLLACAPLDGHRWWRGLLWLWFPMAKAVRLAVVLGFLSAVLLIVLAAWWLNLLLLFCAIAALLSTINDQRMVLAGHDPVFGVDPAYIGNAPQSQWSRRREERAQERLDQELATEQETLDRLLTKVSANGLPALTQAERNELQRISKRQKERAEA